MIPSRAPLRRYSADSALSNPVEYWDYDVSISKLYCQEIEENKINENREALSRLSSKVNYDSYDHELWDRRNIQEEKLGVKPKNTFSYHKKIDFINDKIIFDYSIEDKIKAKQNKFQSNFNPQIKKTEDNMGQNINIKDIKDDNYFKLINEDNLESPPALPSRPPPPIIKHDLKIIPTKVMPSNLAISTFDNKTEFPIHSDEKDLDLMHQISRLNFSEKGEINKISCKKVSMNVQKPNISAKLSHPSNQCFEVRQIHEELQQVLRNFNPSSKYGTELTESNSTPGKNVVGKPKVPQKPAKLLRNHTAISTEFQKLESQENKISVAESEQFVQRSNSNQNIPASKYMNEVLKDPVFQPTKAKKCVGIKPKVPPKPLKKQQHLCNTSEDLCKLKSQEKPVLEKAISDLNSLSSSSTKTRDNQNMICESKDFSSTIFKTHMATQTENNDNVNINKGNPSSKFESALEYAGKNWCVDCPSAQGMKKPDLEYLTAISSNTKQLSPQFSDFDALQDAINRPSLPQKLRSTQRSVSCNSLVQSFKDISMAIWSPPEKEKRHTYDHSTKIIKPSKIKNGISLPFNLNQNNGETVPSKGPQIAQESSKSINLTREKMPSESGIERYLWFHPISGIEAHNRLLNLDEDGAFLVRPRTTPTEDAPYTVSVTHLGRVYNIHLRRKFNGEFALGERGKNFSSISELIKYYQDVPFEIKLSKNSQTFGVNFRVTPPR